MIKFKDISGNKYGRYTVISRDTSRSSISITYWICKCDCGAIRSVGGLFLKNGRSKSCGCFSRDRARELSTTHGMGKHPLCRIFNHMVGRCYNPNDAAWKDYGGRGIKICDEWLENRLLFFKWALSNGWKSGLHTDRIDNNGNYSPENCRFVTAKVNTRNRRSSKMITHNGITKCLGEWCEELSLDYHRTRYRLYVANMPTELAFRNNRYSTNGHFEAHPKPLKHLTTR